MSSGRVTRLSYDESCRLLQRLGYPDAGAEGVIPPIPDHRPQCGDEAPLGVSFFRTWVGVGHPFGLQPSSPEEWVDVAEHALE